MMVEVECYLLILILSLYTNISLERLSHYTEFKALLDAPEKSVEFSKNNVDFIDGFRNSITYDRATGIADFDLRSKLKINGGCE